MGFIRTHPYLSLWIVVTITPLVVGASLLAIRYMPPCVGWRAEVTRNARVAMKERYIGSGDRKAVDQAYQSEGMGYADILNALRRTAEYELAESRPFACI